MDIQEPLEQMSQYQVRIAKTPQNTQKKLLGLGNLNPNAKVLTVEVSRNISLRELIDGVVEYRLPNDDEGNSAGYQAFTLLEVQSKVTSWLLVLVSKADLNSPVSQTHQVTVDFTNL